MSWIAELAGDVYKNWLGNSMVNGGSDTIELMRRLLRQTATKYSLPFDYRLFDHQILKQEQAVIFKKIVATAAENNHGHVGEINEMAAHILVGMEGAKLLVRDGKSLEILDVINGLLSGTKFTTWMSNGWNGTVTEAVLSVLESLGVDTSGVEITIRGDDTVLSSNSPALLRLCQWAYSMLKAQYWKESLDYTKVN